MNKTLKLIDNTTTEFAKKVLAPSRQDNDKYPPSPLFNNIIKKAYDMDLFHVILPESFDGMGLNMRALCTVLSNICEEDSSLGCFIFTHITAQELILLSGENQLLKNENTKQIDKFLIAFQIYENPFEIRPDIKAVKVDNEYKLTGTLKYLVAGHLKGKAIVPANLTNNKIAFFLIDLSENSINLSPPVLSLGLHCCGAVDIELINAKAVLLGSEDKGNYYFSKVTEKMSLAAAAMSLGIMKGSFKEAINYAQKRSQGGKKIIDWSELKMILANMAIQVKNAEMLIDRACQAIDQKESNYGKILRSASISVQSSACQLTTDGIQVLGGVGYMKDFGQEKRYRDAHQIQNIFGIVPLKKLKIINEYIETFL